MRVENFQRARVGEAIRLSADVVWEESPRQPFALFYETDERYGADISEDANAFLCALAIPASRSRERRILLERAVCPRLAEGMTAALALLKRWYPGPRTLPEIETRAGFRASENTAARPALCLTGGVDSLHMLWWNRHHLSPTHPRGFRRAIHVVPVSFPGGDALPRALDVMSRQMRAVSAVCEETGLEFCAVRTNVRQIEPDLSFPQAEGLSAILSSAAHFQGQGLSSISIASSSYEASNFRPWGTHPLLDPSYSSGAVDVIHRDAGVSRTEKVRRIAAWEPACRHLYVCFEGPLPEGRVNCGRCEKCLRTMTALAAAGALDRFESFGGLTLTPEAVRNVPFGYEPGEFPDLWSPLAASMEALGRQDLARAIRSRVGQARRYLRWRSEEDWKGTVRRIDRKLLGGILTAVTRRARRLASNGGAVNGSSS